MGNLSRLKILATKTTPEVDFNPDTGILVIKGASFSENPESFYKPLYNWIDEYLKNPQKTTVAKFLLYFFNTSSAMRILDIFKRLKRLADSGKEVIIKWYYIKSDDDMLEAGNDYQSILEIPFEFIEIDKNQLDTI